MKKRISQEERNKLQQEALYKARAGATLTNYPAIVTGFIEKGISPDDIKPRENVYTFNAWKALGRCVKKGEHGVKVVTFIPEEKEVSKDDGTKEIKQSTRPWSATVFHISQTIEV